jgi:hypothetical protein
MARLLVGGFLALHGIAHAAGFSATWQFAATADNPYTTSVLNGTVDVGEGWIRLVGVLWLVAAAGMFAAAVGVWTGARHALGGVVAATAFSLAMCLVGLPAAGIGVAIDVAILGIIAAAAIHGRGMEQMDRRGSVG